MLLRLLLLLALLVPALPAGAWESSDLGLRLPDPAGWEVRPEPAPGDGVWYLAPPGPGPRPSLSLRTCPVQEDLSRELVHEAVRTLAAQFSGFKLLASRPDQVQGLPAHRLAYQAAAEGYRFQATQVLWVRGGRLYLLTLAAPQDRHGALLPVLDRVLAGLEFTGEPPQVR